MRLSRKSALLLRIAVAIGLVFIYVPLIIIAIYAFSSSNILEWPPPGLTLDWFPEGDRKPERPRRAAHLAQGGPRRDRDRAAARHARRAGRRPPPLLRPRDDLLPRHPADRPAGDRHRRGDQQHLHPGAGHRPRPLHGDRRPRHLLHRRRLQQRRSPACAASRPPSRRPRPTSAPTPGRPSATSPCPACARRSPPAPCSPSPSPSTRSSSPRSRSAPAEETLPIWIFRNLFRPSQLPIVNVVAVLVVLISIIPVYLAHRLTREEGGAAPTGGKGGRIEGGGVETSATAVP